MGKELKFIQQKKETIFPLSGAKMFTYSQIKIIILITLICIYPKKKSVEGIKKTILFITLRKSI
jgi:hypothetical protein